MGIYLSQPDKQKITKCGSNNQFEYVQCSTRGWRKSMEDFSFCELDVEDHFQIFGVIDGHGGYQVAQFVHQNFLKLFLKNSSIRKYLKAKKNGNQNTEEQWQTMIELGIYQTILSLDEEMKTIQGFKQLIELSDVNKFDKSNQIVNCGCSVCISIICENTIFVTNVGNTRCFVSKINYSYAINVSIQHTPLILSENERIKKAGGSIIKGRVNGNLRITRSIGDFQYKNNQKFERNQQLLICDPHMCKLKSISEFMVFGTDGLFDILSQDDIISMIKEGMKQKDNLIKISHDILDKAYGDDVRKFKGLNNMTILIVKKI